MNLFYNLPYSLWITFRKNPYSIDFIPSQANAYNAICTSVFSLSSRRVARTINRKFSMSQNGYPTSPLGDRWFRSSFNQSTIKTEPFYFCLTLFIIKTYRRL